MKNLLLIFISAILISFTGSSCKQSATKQIRSHAVFFYAGYDGNYRTADRSVFTREFAELMDKTSAMEKEEAAKMKAGPTPTDKPRMIEGDVLCGLYEGFNKYEVKEIRETPNEAVVTIELRNTNYNITWADTLIMKQQGGWKIDDIRFGKKQGFASSSRDVFSQFLNFKQKNC
jgi:hypothetical protein